MINYMNMEREEVYMKVREMTINELGLEDVAIDEKTNLARDFGIDSLDIIDLLIRIDMEFGINTGDNPKDIEMMCGGTISDIVNVVERLLKEKKLNNV